MKFRLPRGRLLAQPKGSSKTRPPPTPMPAGNSKFDATTGQMFTESIVEIQGDEDRDWIYKQDTRTSATPSPNNPSPSTPVPANPVLKRKSPRSLVDTCIECLLQNTDMLTIEGIQAIPEHYFRRIWEECVNRDLVTFHIWKLFVTLMDPQDASVLNFFRHRQHIENPKSTFNVFTVPLTSPSFTFLTSLSITTIVTLHELVQLSSIVNLGVLEIIHSTKFLPSPVSDRLIRSWHKSVIGEGAFPVLRVLKLWNHSDLTADSLKYVNDFPALAVYDVKGCDIGAKAKVNARPLGWTPHLETNLVSLLESACLQRAIKMRKSLRKEEKPLRRTAGEQLPEKSIVYQIPRKDIPEFLSAVGEPPEPCGRPVPLDRTRKALADPSPQMHAGRGLGTKKTCSAMDNFFYKKPRKLQDWDFTTTSVFTRIGELRNDSDLKHAGINIGEQAIVGVELINSLPLMSLRLGLTLPSMKPDFDNSGLRPLFGRIELDTTHADRENLARLPENLTHFGHDTGNLSFIRIKAPEVKVRDENATTHEQAPSKKSQKRNAPIMMKDAKKLDLGNVLNTFSFS